MLHRPREELIAYDRAIALEPDHVEVWNRRATALQRLGRFAEMLQASQRARLMRPMSSRGTTRASHMLDSDAILRH
jgi:hypothetical protein